MGSRLGAILRSESFSITAGVGWYLVKRQLQVVVVANIASPDLYRRGRNDDTTYATIEKYHIRIGIHAAC